MTEYGADAVAGLYMDPPLIWSEDYQLQMMENYFQGFDDLYRKGHLIGEMIWNFADFATVQGNTRVVGNKKGVFTRDRQPKGSARLLRKRYTQLNHWSWSLFIWMLHGSMCMKPWLNTINEIAQLSLCPNLINRNNWPMWNPWLWGRN